MQLDTLFTPFSKLSPMAQQQVIREHRQKQAHDLTLAREKEAPARVQKNTDLKNFLREFGLSLDETDYLDSLGFKMKDLIELTNLKKRVEFE